MQTSAERRVELDWIRIGAFGLLILYHVGMYYTTWDWHVKSPWRSRALDVVMLWSNPWRLGLLFLVAGAATRFMSERYAPARLARSRSARLLLPLLFGMLVIVPPQSYLEVVEKLGYADGFAAFYARYLAADGSFCPAQRCIILPTWNHLWFVAYLWAYTMLAAAALAARPGLIGGAERILARLLAGPGLFLAPVATLAAARLVLHPVFGSTHALIDDWYNHAVFLPLLALGFLLARDARFWARVEAARWMALGLALASYAAIAASYGAFGTSSPAHGAMHAVMRVVYGVDQWAWIVAILGFGRRFLSEADGPARRYLTDAIFPCYIVHQTVVIVLAHHLEPYALPVAAEVAINLAATIAAGFAAYEIARRLSPMRPWFGLKPALGNSGPAYGGAS